MNYGYVKVYYLCTLKEMLHKMSAVVCIFSNDIYHICNLCWYQTLVMILYSMAMMLGKQENEQKKLLLFCWWLVQNDEKKLKMTETLAHGYLSDCTQ